MYIHLGSKKSVPEKYIVGIFDLDGEVTTKITGEFLAKAQSGEIVSAAGDDIPRSFVLCADKKRGRGYPFPYIFLNSCTEI